jgi:hypothetical protein
VVMGIVAVLFHRQSKVARANADRQADYLHHAEERGEARLREYDLVSSISDPARRDSAVERLLGGSTTHSHSGRVEEKSCARCGSAATTKGSTDQSIEVDQDPGRAQNT